MSAVWQRGGGATEWSGRTVWGADIDTQVIEAHWLRRQATMARPVRRVGTAPGGGEGAWWGRGHTPTHHRQCWCWGGVIRFAEEHAQTGCQFK